jgi:hypothetical protein
MEHELRQGTKMKTAKRLSCAIASMLLMMLLVTSCAFHEQLPSNWTLPAPVHIGNCPDISGQYVSMGETIKNKTTVSLIYELFVIAKDRKQYPLVRWKEVSHISIQQQGQNLLNIVAWKGKEVLYSTSLSKDSNDFICEDGWLKVETSTLQGYSSSAAGFNSTSRNFANSDGYLLEKRETNSLLMLSILPVIGSSVEWFRFARSEQPE